MQSTHQSCSGPACPFSSCLFFFFACCLAGTKQNKKRIQKAKKRNSQFVPSYFSPAPFFSGLLPCPHVHRVHFPFSLSSLRLSSSRLSQTQQFPAVVFFRLLLFVSCWYLVYTRWWLQLLFFHVFLELIVFVLFCCYFLCFAICLSFCPFILLLCVFLDFADLLFVVSTVFFCISLVFFKFVDS